MNEHSGQRVSLWMATADRPEFPRLTWNAHAEVCIIGAGIAGLTTAYLLARAGKSVMVLDDGPIISGETERTTAHLSTALDDRYVELERMHGTNGARLASTSHAAAIDEIERIIAAESIDCDFERLDGYLFMPPGETSLLLERELAAAHRAGLTDVELVPRSPIASFDTGTALRFPRQAQFHPLKYLAKLATAIVRDGGQIYSRTHVSRVKSESPSMAVLETNDGTLITAQSVVVATNTPFNDRLAIHTKQAAYRTYVLGALIPSGSIASGLYWDTLDPYHYVRIQSLSTEGVRVPNDMLLVGGEDHKTGQADDGQRRFRNLEDWSRARFPMMGDIQFCWSGQVMEPVDGLAYIGRNPGDSENIYIATGDSGHGMTHGTIAGMLLKDLILGRPNPWAELYDPSRKTLRALKDFAGDALNMAVQYSDWATAGDFKHEDLIPPGSGAVIRRGLKKVAVYCDLRGEMHECSAVCPHLEGIVSWNHTEETWDCPVHGSRFDPFGKVLNGPASGDLSPVETKAHAI